MRGIESSLTFSRRFRLEGMWLTDEDSSLCWFNPGSSFPLFPLSFASRRKRKRSSSSFLPSFLASLESAEQYTLIGVVVGLAVYHASVLDIPLPRAAFKRLLNKPVTLDDLAEWQPALARGLKNLLKFEGDVEAVYCRSFVGEVSRRALASLQRKKLISFVSVAQYESYGEIISVPLTPGGADIPVTAKNREGEQQRPVLCSLFFLTLSGR